MIMCRILSQSSSAGWPWRVRCGAWTNWCVRARRAWPARFA